MSVGDKAFGALEGGLRPELCVKILVFIDLCEKFGGRAIGIILLVELREPEDDFIQLRVVGIFLFDEFEGVLGLAALVEFDLCLGEQQAGGDFLLVVGGGLHRQREDGLRVGEVFLRVERVRKRPKDFPPFFICCFRTLCGDGLEDFDGVVRPLLCGEAERLQQIQGEEIVWLAGRFDLGENGFRGLRVACEQMDVDEALLDVEVLRVHVRQLHEVDQQGAEGGPVVQLGVGVRAKDGRLFDVGGIRVLFREREQSFQAVFVAFLHEADLPPDIGEFGFDL